MSADPVPSYLPARGQAILPWLRAHVAAVAARSPAVDRTDLWDEAIAAVLRACVHFNPVPPPGTGNGRNGSPYSETKAFAAYAKLAVTRGLWRYALSAPNGTRHGRQRRQIRTCPLEDVPGLAVPSTEDEAIARELQLPSAEDEAIARETIQCRLAPHPAPP